MTEQQFEQLRPWHDGTITDPGYTPAAALILKGYLRREFDNFYTLTEKGRRELGALRQGRKARVVL